MISRQFVFIKSFNFFRILRWSEVSRYSNRKEGNTRDAKCVTGEITTKMEIPNV